MSHTHTHRVNTSLKNKIGDLINKAGGRMVGEVSKPSFFYESLCPTPKKQVIGDCISVQLCKIGVGDHGDLRVSLPFLSSLTWAT